jgi:hypothetical protein
MRRSAKPELICIIAVPKERTLLPRTGQPQLMVRRPHAGEQIAAAGASSVVLPLT